MKVEIIPCLSDNFSYLIHDKESDKVSIVDPADYNACDEVIKKYKKLDFILNTHHHNDHVGGNMDLKKKYNSKIICSSYDEEKIPGQDIKKSDGDQFSFGETDFEIMHIPGHTLGHIAFYSEKANIIFTGDTLFSLGCGRIFEGTFKQMFGSLEKIKNLPKNTLMYCGHEYTEKNGQFCISIDKENTKLKNRIEDVKSKTQKKLPTLPIAMGEEIETNIFLRCDDEKIKNNLKMNNGSKLEVFTKLRNLKDKF